MTCPGCLHADRHDEYEGCRNVDPYDEWECPCEWSAAAVSEAVATERAADGRMAA